MIDNMTVYELFRNSNFFGVCETAGATADKEVQIADFELAAGVTAMVKFKYSNTAISPTLNISNTGAKPICGEDPEAEVRWEEWDVIPFTYDGTYWQMTNNPGIKVDQIPLSTGGFDYRVLLGKTADNEQHLEEVYKANNFRYTPDNYELVVDDGLEDSGTEHTSNMNMIMDAAHKFAPAQTGSEVLVIGGDDYYRISCSSGNEDDMRAQVVYRYELSYVTRKVRYKLEVRDSMASDPEGLFAIYVGFRDEYDETNFVTPDEFTILKSYNTPNTTIEDELDLTGVGNGYIYVLANSWNLDLLKFEEVSYSEKPHMLKGYLSNNSSGVIYNDNGFERSIVSSVTRNNHPELTLSYNNMYMMKNELTISDNDIVLSGIDNTWDGTNTSLKTALSVMPYYAVLIDFAAGTNTGTHTLEYGHFNDYDFLIFIGNGNSKISQFVQRYDFATTNNSIRLMDANSTGLSGLTISYLSRNSFSVSAFSGIGTTPPVVKLQRIIGIKMNHYSYPEDII